MVPFVYFLLLIAAFLVTRRHARRLRYAVEAAAMEVDRPPRLLRLAWQAPLMLAGLFVAWLAGFAAIPAPESAWANERRSGPRSNAYEEVTIHGRRTPAPHYIWQAENRTLTSITLELVGEGGSVDLTVDQDLDWRLEGAGNSGFDSDAVALVLERIGADPTDPRVQAEAACLHALMIRHLRGEPVDDLSDGPFEEGYGYAYTLRCGTSALPAIALSWLLHCCLAFPLLSILWHRQLPHTTTGLGR